MHGTMARLVARRCTGGSCRQSWHSGVDWFVPATSAYEFLVSRVDVEVEAVGCRCSARDRLAWHWSDSQDGSCCQLSWQSSQTLGPRGLYSVVECMYGDEYTMLRACHCLISYVGAGHLAEQSCTVTADCKVWLGTVTHVGLCRCCKADTVGCELSSLAGNNHP
jgi:hypothetical protein